MAQEAPAFDPINDATPERPYRPADHLMEINSRGGRTAYMKVDDRVIWFRSDYPQGVIRQEIVKLDMERGFALFKTTVETGAGGAAEGYGSETMEDFGDWIEKAASKSLARALSVLGYGTKGALAEGEMAESPADLPHLGSRGGNRANAPAPYGPATDFTQAKPAPAQQYQQRGPDGARAPGQGGGDPGNGVATERQVKFIRAIAREAKLTDAALEAWCDELYQQPDVDKLTRRDASDLIERIQRRRGDVS